MQESESVTPGQQVKEIPLPLRADAELKPETKKARKASKPAKKEHRAQADELLKIGSKEYEKVILPESEDDPHWDPKLRNPVPDGLVENLADFGWDPSMAAIAIREGKSLKLVHGKTRWRALPKANALRAKKDLEPIEALVLVVDEDPGSDEQILRNMERNVMLNYSVQRIDPMTTAEGITRLLSAGLEEREVARRFNMSVNDLHGHLLLTDESKCPVEVQEMLREGKISFTGALELARQADKLSKSEIKAAAEQLARAAAGGVRVTASQVKRAAGDTSGGPATQKEKKQFLLDLQSDPLTGKHGEAATWAAIVAMEVGLGTRTINSALGALKKIAHGETVRVDFKQYQDGTKQDEPATPVKGQAAPAKGKKSSKKK